MIRVLLLGAGGMLGSDIVAHAPATCEVTGLTRQQLDLSDVHATTKAVADMRPQVIVNAAAYTAVDKAETAPDQAFAANEAAVERLAKLARDARATLVHFSTDYVFAGDAKEPYLEDAPPQPINTYGASKLAGERAIERIGSRFLIIRTSWLFGRHGRSFPRTMWERASKQQQTRVVNDQYGRPTFTVDLARATWSLITAQRTGLFHVANEGITTWFDMAYRIFDHLGQAQLLTPCKATEYVLPAKRPGYSVLGTQYRDLPFAPLRDWREALDEFLACITLE